MPIKKPRVRLNPKQMAAPPLTLIFLSLLSLLATSIAAKTTTTSFINVSCTRTLYPSLCNSTLSPYASCVGKSRKKLSIYAISVSLSEASASASYLKRLSKVAREKADRAALNDCIDGLQTGEDQMNDSINELRSLKKKMREFHLSNVQTWLSAALTNVDTCSDGFGPDSTSKVKEAVIRKVDRVGKLVSNALALVNLFARGT